MARRSSNGSAPEVSLFPFLSILACLIGALVLMITAMVVSTATDTGGLSPEDFEMAVTYKKLSDEKNDKEAEKDRLLTMIEGVDKEKKKLAEVNREILKLNEEVKLNKELKERGEINDEDQQKRDLLAEEKKMLVTEQIPEHTLEIKRLQEEIAKLDVKPTAPPPMIVPPSGSGLPDGTEIYFIESGSGAINVLDRSGKSILRVPLAAVPTNSQYAAYLQEIKKRGAKARIFFLVREDGLGGYNNGGGLAQMSGISVGKLPVPGKGPVDLRLFEKYAGPPVTIPEPEPEPEPEPPAAPEAEAGQGPEGKGKGKQ